VTNKEALGVEAAASSSESASSPEAASSAEAAASSVLDISVEVGPNHYAVTVSL
jgi:hypothetical protein